MYTCINVHFCFFAIVLKDNLCMSGGAFLIRILATSKTVEQESAQCNFAH